MYVEGIGKIKINVKNLKMIMDYIWKMEIVFILVVDNLVVMMCMMEFVNIYY